MPNITVLLVLVIIVPTILYLEISASKKHFKKHFFTDFAQPVASQKTFPHRLRATKKHFLTDFAQPVAGARS